MNPMFALTFLFVVAVVNGATTEQTSKDGQPTKLSDAIIAKYGEQPCLNKVIGQRLTHPTDPHKFLRCMSLEALWIETCPDGLFYNPSMELCDWSTKPRPTTHSNEVVKHRPVLFKTKLTDGGQVQSELVEQQPTSVGRKISNQMGEEPVEKVVETTTGSLLEELRKKLNLVDQREVADEPATSVKKPSLRLVEVDRSERKQSSSSSDKTERGEDVDLEKSAKRGEDVDLEKPANKKPSLRLIEVTTTTQETPEVSQQESRDFEVQSTTTQRLFLKSLEKKLKKAESSE